MKPSKKTTKKKRPRSDPTPEPNAAQDPDDAKLDEVVGIAGDDGLLLEVDTATVVFARGEVRNMWKQDKAILWFKILDPAEHLGKELFLPCPMPKNRKFNVGHKFKQCWTLASGRKPDRFDRMTMRVFQGKTFVAKLKTVIKNQHGPLPPHAHYTIIETLLSKG